MTDTMIQLDDGLIINNYFKRTFAAAKKEKKLSTKALMSDLTQYLAEDYRHLWSAIFTAYYPSALRKAIDLHLKCNGSTSLEKIINIIDEKKMQCIDSNYFLSIEDVFAFYNDVINENNKFGLLKELNRHNMVRKIKPKMPLSKTKEEPVLESKIDYSFVGYREATILNKITKVKKSVKSTQLEINEFYERNPFWILKYRKIQDPLEKTKIAHQLFEANIPIMLKILKRANEKIGYPSLDPDLMFSIIMEESYKKTLNFLESNTSPKLYLTYLTNHLRWHLFSTYFKESSREFLVSHPVSVTKPAIASPVSLDIYYKLKNDDQYITASDLLLDPFDIEEYVTDNMRKADIQDYMAALISTRYTTKIRQDNPDYELIYGRYLIVLFDLCYFENGRLYDASVNLKISQARMGQLRNKLLRQLRGQINNDDSNIDFKEKAKDLITKTDFIETDPAVLNIKLLERQKLWDKKHPLPKKSKNHNIDLSLDGIDPLLASAEKRKEYFPDKLSTYNEKSYPNTRIIGDMIRTTFKNEYFRVNIDLVGRSTILVSKENTRIKTIYFEHEYLHIDKANANYYKIVDAATEHLSFPPRSRYLAEKALKSFRHFLNEEKAQEL